MSSISKYGGNILLNTRTVINTANMLKDWQGANREKVSVRELAELWSLLETLIVSKELYYDGTVGGNTLDELQKAETVIESNTDHPGASEILLAAMPENQDQLNRMCLVAADQAELSIRRETETLDFASARESARDGRPIDTDDRLNKFAQIVTNPPNSPSEMRALAADLNENLDAFRGTKCVAGILLASANATERDSGAETLLSHCGKIVAAQPDRIGIGIVLQSMINCFRSSYLGSLANERCSAAFHVHEDIARIKTNSNELIANYIAQQLIRQNVSTRSFARDLFVETLSKREPMPWIGLLCFLQSKKKDPFSMFAHALENRNDFLPFINAKHSINTDFLDETRFADETVKREFVETHYGNVLERARGLGKGADLSARVLFGISMQDALKGMAFVVRQIDPEIAEIIEDVATVTPPLDLENVTPRGSKEAFAGVLRRQALNEGESCLVAVHAQLAQSVNNAITSDQPLGEFISDRTSEIFGWELTR